MDIWSQLGIEATSDARTIKRAYASKLKVTRPDEHPEAFQDLHYAYKAALNYAYYEQQELQQTQSHGDQTSEMPLDNLSPQPISNSVDIDPAEHIVPESELPDVSTMPQATPTAMPATTSDDFTTPDNSTTPGNSTIPDNSTAEDTQQQQETETNALQLEGERLMALVGKLLNSNNELHVPDSWEFLLHSPYILDDQFNWRLGLEILRLIQMHNQQHSNKPLMQIGSGVMTWLDGVFNWKLNRHHIYRFFDEEQFAPLLDKIAEQEPLQQTQHALDGLRGAKSIKVVETHKQPGTLYYASPIKRFIALLIDMAGMFIIATLILHDITNNTASTSQAALPPEAALIITMLLSFVYFWVCECSSVQATLGKLIMGLIVTNKNFEQMTGLQGFLRSLVFHLSSLLSYIILIINAMMGDKLLHDRITKTWVIDIRRSRQQS